MFDEESTADKMYKKQGYFVRWFSFADMIKYPILDCV